MKYGRFGNPKGSPSVTAMVSMVLMASGSIVVFDVDESF